MDCESEAVKHVGKIDGVMQYDKILTDDEAFGLIRTFTDSALGILNVALSDSTGAMWVMLDDEGEPSPS